MKIDVMGTEYTVNYYNYNDKPIFAKRECDGYCDDVDKEIAVVKMNTFPGYEDETEEYCKKIEKSILRHEIVHAFLNESGLKDSSLNYSGGWAKNEEMVAWIANQFHKIKKAFEEVDCM